MYEIPLIRSMKFTKTFFLAFPALNSTTMIKKLQYSIPPIVAIGTVKTLKTFFFAFPALNSTAMIKKLKYSNSYLITIQRLNSNQQNSPHQ